MEPEQPEPGELVYVSGNQVKTRRWIWRQSDDGKITSESSAIFFPLDGFKGINDDVVITARDELAGYLEEFFRCPVKIGLVKSGSPVMEL
ncbi:MAG: hypothetical protein AB1767_07795 [Bacillota bacterium]